jgi:hypothetical protein
MGARRGEMLADARTGRSISATHGEQEDSLFAEILRLIAELRPPPHPAPA